VGEGEFASKEKNLFGNFKIKKSLKVNFAGRRDLIGREGNYRSVARLKM